MKKKSNFLIVLIVFFGSNFLSGQSIQRFDSISIRYIYNTILNHYLSTDDFLSLPYSGMTYDLKTDHVKILKNNIKDKDKLSYYRRQFQLDTFELLIETQGKYDISTLVSQFKIKVASIDENEIQSEMLKDTNCVVLCQFSDIFSYHDRYIFFARISNLFIDTIVTFEYMYEFQFCPMSNFFEFIKWHKVGGIFFEGEKAIYMNKTYNFQDMERLCGD